MDDGPGRETIVRTLARSDLGNGVVVTTIGIHPGVGGYRRLDGREYETAVARGDDLTVAARYETEEEALVWHDLYATWLAPAGLDGAPEI